MREQAQTMGYTVVDAGTVIATHLNHIINAQSATLLGRQEVQQLLDHVAKDAPKLVEDLVPKVLPLATLQRVLQQLLEESVHIRDMRSIIETIAEHATRVQDPTELASLVRVSLGAAIAQQIFGSTAELQVAALDPALERLLMQTLQSSTGDGVGIEPGLADTLLREAAAAARHQEQLGQPAVLLVPAALRPLLSRFLRRAVPQLRVLSQLEIPDSKSIRVMSIVGGKA